MKRTAFFIITVITLLLLLTSCKDNAWNNPNKKSTTTNNVRYSSFAEPPKTLDPALAYSVEENLFIAQIYEPPLQYNYLLRPYQLEPLSANQMPTVSYYDAKNNLLPNNAPNDKVAYTVYTIHIKPGIHYQPHPAFAKDNQGNYLYLHLTENDILKKHQLSDFPNTNTRELTADDYVYQIKRLASPKLNSPILGLMSKYIVGLSDYAKTLQPAYQQQTVQHGKDSFFDLREYPLAGVKTVDRYTYQISIYGKYPQFIYWLAMPFFSPIPWEADAFYSQPGMDEHNIGFDWYPIGTGPYFLAKNNPNSQIILSRNPNFHGERYPTQGEASDKENGLLDLAGQPLPFVDQFIFSLEKESIPRWSKFLQGYYDLSAITSDSFDQAIQVNAKGEPQLTPLLINKGIRLQTSVSPSIYYFGFNMLDDVVGGNGEPARKLRQAISIAINTEEFIAIFLNGRGIPAQGPIPPGVFGYLKGEAGINPYVYVWQNNQPHRRSLDEAKKLLAEAGYPNGRNLKTGEPLTLNYDVTASSAPDDKARFDWMREQFNKLGIQLNIRPTLYNRFQEKMRSGNTQIYFWGWLADYPDPENFLFLLYGPNGKVKQGGENASNYNNPEYDKLFESMKLLPDGPERQAVINKMVEILRHDTPWVWGFHSQDFVLSHPWIGKSKPNSIEGNILKYQTVNPVLRQQLQQQWNRPNYWPLLVIGFIILIALVPVIILYRRKQHSPRVRKTSLFRKIK